MEGYFIGFVMSAMLTGLLISMFLPFAHRLGLLDRPGGRKDHAHPTPVTGGLAIAIAVVVTLFVVHGYSAMFAAFAAASLVMIVVGLLDDAYDLRWWWRIVSQVAAGLIMVYWGGVQVDYVGPIFTDAPIVLGAWAVPFTLFATVGLINAVNMCDGADGLAGSLCLVALVMLSAAALYSGNNQLFAWLLPITAAVAVFLVFNLRFLGQRRAKVFLGNSGSAFLGFTIAFMAFRLTQNSAHPVSPVLAPWLLAAPIVDCLVLIARRLKLGRSPFHGDRDHMHHLLLDAGFEPTQVAIGLASLSVLLGTFAAVVLRTNVGNETHLIVGFGVLVVGYYWLTARRFRAVQTFKRLRLALMPEAAAKVPEHARGAFPMRRTHGAPHKKMNLVDEARFSPRTAERRAVDQRRDGG